MNGQPLEKVDNCCDLGLTNTSKFTWNTHVDISCKKASRSEMSCSRLSLSKKKFFVNYNNLDCVSRLIFRLCNILSLSYRRDFLDIMFTYNCLKEKVDINILMT